MTRAPDEFDIQRAWCLWYGGEQWAAGPLKGTWKIQPAQLPGVEWWHTPNSGEGRDAFQGARLKQAGVKAGIHDILLLSNGRLYGLEFKKPGGVLSPAQRAMHPRLLAAGMVASATVDSLEGAKAVVRSWRLTLC